LTDPKRRKLSHEILGLLAVTLLLSAVLMTVLYVFGSGIIDSYWFRMDVVPSETQLAEGDSLVFNGSLLISVIFFFLLFLALLGERLAYIRELTRGIDALRQGEAECHIPLEGNNELTQLAEAIHYLSDTQQQVRQQERALAEEKEQLIRTLSHDIRTPLTSILSYSEMLAAQQGPIPHDYPQLVLKKTRQIQALTDILLDGGIRKPEYFEDARLLFFQLAEEWEETLEGQFPIRTDLALDTPFSGHFDVQELRRVLDNLCSNIEKYADPIHPVMLSIHAGPKEIVIRQSNAVALTAEKTEGFQVGLQSIRRIAQNYGGSIQVDQDKETFTITITLLVS